MLTMSDIRFTLLKGIDPRSQFYFDFDQAYAKSSRSASEPRILCLYLWSLLNKLSPLVQPRELSMLGRIHARLLGILEQDGIRLFNTKLWLAPDIKSSNKSICSKQYREAIESTAGALAWAGLDERMGFVGSLNREIAYAILSASESMFTASNLLLDAGSLKEELEQCRATVHMSGLADYASPPITTYVERFEAARPAVYQELRELLIRCLKGEEQMPDSPLI